MVKFSMKGLRVGLVLLGFCLSAFSAASPATDMSPGQSSAGPGDSWSKLDPDKLRLRSQSALIVDADGNVIYSKDAERAMPIASITKLMTAIVVLDAGVPLDERIPILKTDRDLLRLTGSRLRYGKAALTRRELLILALMASENRAAAALGRTTFPGGDTAFVEKMNRKAKALGMSRTGFVDAAGLDARNISTARDLVKLLRAAARYPLLREASTRTSAEVYPYKRLGSLRYVNTNRLLKSSKWDIGLSKTGYIDEAGRCLVMQTNLFSRPLYVVLLNSFGKLTPFGDSNRLRQWLKEELGV